MPSLIACTCTADACTCSDPFSTGVLDALAAKQQHKDNSTVNNDLSRISDLLASLAPQQREKVIRDLPPNTRKILIDELTAAAKTSTRVDTLLASANYQRDRMVEKVTGELRRL